MAAACPFPALSEQARLGQQAATLSSCFCLKRFRAVGSGANFFPIL
jgi:hypothetical protein